MVDNFIEAQYDVTKKSKILKFYQENKILIYSVIFLILILTAYIFFSIEKKEKNNMALANSYIEAKIYLENGDKNKAKEILTSIIYKSDSTYSAMSLFFILNKNLIDDKEELFNLFDYILSNKKFDDEIKNLILFKKALFQSNFSTELELLKIVKPILNSDSLWRPYALLLLGDYFASKKEYKKAKEFYMKILSIRNLQKELYDHANLQLTSINLK
jgi:tetratricopeptide (TPR) repeat protein